MDYKGLRHPWLFPWISLPSSELLRTLALGGDPGPQFSWHLPRLWAQVACDAPQGSVHTG